MKLKMRKGLSSKQRLYHLNIPLIGLTGGIASGKSSVLQYFNKKGFSVLCADELIKKIYRKSSTQEFIVKICPLAIDTKTPTINFKLLREWAFHTPQNREQLECFLYPLLKELFLEEIFLRKKISHLLYDLPLLFENKLESYFDCIICIFIDRNRQIERLTKRDQISSQFANVLINSQIDLYIKKRKSDYTIDNQGSFEDTKDEIDHFIAEYFHDSL